MTKGYTLAEVVICMLVIAVVAGVCIKITKTKLDNITKVNYYVAYDTLRKAALEMYNNYKVCEGVSCTGGNELDTESCSCVCKQTPPSDIPCGQSWDAEQCQLVDIELPTCKSGYEFDETTCGCVKSCSTLSCSSGYEFDETSCSCVKSCSTTLSCSSGYKWDEASCSCVEKSCSGSCNIDGVYIEGIGTLRDLGTSYSPIDTCDGTSEWDSNFTSSQSKYCDKNYWAGAKKACADIGMELSDEETLLSIYNSLLDAAGCRPCRYFWSSSEHYASRAFNVNFSDGYTYYGLKDNSNLRALCVGN